MSKANSHPNQGVDRLKIKEQRQINEQVDEWIRSTNNSHKVHFKEACEDVSDENHRVPFETIPPAWRDICLKCIWHWRHE